MSDEPLNPEANHIEARLKALWKRSILGTVEVRKLCGSSRGGITPSDTEYFILPQRFQTRLVDGGDGDGVAKGVEDLDGVAVFAARPGMMVDDLHHVTRTKALPGEVASKDGVGIEFKGHRRDLSGTKVMNFVRPDKCSVIQIAQMRSVRPLGPVRGARIS